MAIVAETRTRFFWQGNGQKGWRWLVAARATVARGWALSYARFLATRLLAVSVDVDGIDQYLAIHGLQPSTPVDGDAVHTKGVRRLADWADNLGIPLTWFVVGRDLDRPDFAAWCAERCRRGDELASHSLDHLYDLTRMSPARRRLQLEESFSRIRALGGGQAVGFRAPGYTVTDALLAELSELGVAYDSSVFPCPWYYGAKATVIGGMRLLGRTSRSILDTPRVLLAPRRPYRIGQPYSRAGRGLLEFPIQVTPLSRLPYIGTSLGMLGPAFARLLSTELRAEPVVNLELHALDALDANDGLGALGAVQRDLRVPYRRKLLALSAAVETLLRRGFGPRRLDEVARAIGGQLAEGVFAG